MKTKNNRLLRIGENIRAVLSRQIILNELYDPELNNTIITITEVQPSRDLRHAKVFVSSIGKDEEKVAQILNGFSNALSKLVAKELETKYSPKLAFFADLSFSNASKIKKLIDENVN